MSLPQSILVATDFGECSQDALEHAFQLAEKLDAKVHLIHVFTLLGVQNTAALPPSVLEDAEMGALQRVRSVAEGYRSTGRVGEALAWQGDPAATILRAAQEVSADLIMLGTHNRRGLSRLMLGSVAEAVVRKASCSVLVVRARATEQ